MIKIIFHLKSNSKPIIEYTPKCKNYDVYSMFKDLNKVNSVVLWSGSTEPIWINKENITCIETKYIKEKDNGS